MNKGFIKLHRNMLEWEWYDCHSTMRLWLHLLLRANYKDTRYMGHEIKKGSLVTGYATLGQQAGLSVQQVRTAMNKLKSTGEITIKKTNKFSIVSITKWDEYQVDNRQSNTPSTNEQHSNNIQVTPSKEVKKERREEDIEAAAEMYNEMAKKINIPLMQKLTQTRKASLVKRLQDCGGLDGWRAALEKLEASSFCRGDNEKGWKADFDFLIRESSFVKLMEGKYDGNTGKSSRESKGQRLRRAAYEGLSEEARTGDIC